MAQAKSDEKRGSGNSELKQRLLVVLLALCRKSFLRLAILA